MKKPRKLKIASLFSGCGGSDLGMLGGFDYLGKRYTRLSTEIVFALDNDKKAIETYNYNFKHKALHKNIEELSLNEVPDEIDILVGGFPCQSFSTINPNKDPFDERGQLYKHMAVILKKKKPKVFIAENVRGMLVLHNGAIYRKIEEEFSKAGYIVQHKLINSADFGVPQKRQRVFMVGVRKDIKNIFEYPIETHSKMPIQRQNKWVGVGTVIDQLFLDDKKYYFSKKAVDGMRNAKNNMKRGLWQDLNEPCLTVTSHLAKVSINSRDPVLLVDKEKDLYRRFTPLEAARIQSFPDDFVFVGSDADAYRQIGNAIAPVVIWHLVKQIIKTLDN